MNISTEIYEMLCGWLSCVQMEPGESPINWAKRGLAMRVDKDMVLIEMPRAEFEQSCKDMVDAAMAKITRMAKND